MEIVIVILTSLINLLLIWAVSKKSQPKQIVHHVPHKLGPKIEGKLQKYYISAKIAEKFAERAFNMASAANLGVVALQKSLATPKIMTAQQSIKNQLAKKEVDKLFSTDGGFDFLRPILSDEENDILDSIEQQKLKAAARTNGVS